MAREAYEGYVACGKNLEALRTHVGRMSVLLELGLYREALDAGQVVLDALMAQVNSGLHPRDSSPTCLPRLCTRTAAVATNTWVSTKKRSQRTPQQKSAIGPSA